VIECSGDFFEGHSRDYVVHQICDGKTKIDIPEEFYRFSSTERLLILKAIKQGRITVDYSQLLPRLTTTEQTFLIGGGIR
jgi:hypothetical protein